MEITGKIWMFVFGIIIGYGMLYVVLADGECDAVLAKSRVLPDYADSVGSTNMTVCSGMMEIVCGGQYAPSLLEKHLSIFYGGTSSCDYVTIFLLGKHSDTETTSLRWLVYNVPAQDLKNGYRGQSGDEVIRFSVLKNMEAPALHVIFIYCQPGEIVSFSVQNKDNIEVKSLAEAKKLGQPILALCFYVTAPGQLMLYNSSTYSGRQICQQ